MGTRRNPTDLITNADCVILDFDGPVCQVFAGVDSALLAEGIRTKFDLEHNTDDPLAHILAALPNRELATEIHEYLAGAERWAIDYATETPGARNLILTLAKPIAIASNNAKPAIGAWLKVNGLEKYVSHIEGRRPLRMKPHPDQLIRCASALDVETHDCVFIGDSTTDAEAAQAADMPFIALANKPGKHEAFTSAGCEQIISSMEELSEGQIPADVRI